MESDPEMVGAAIFMTSLSSYCAECVSPVTCAGDPGASWTIGGGILDAPLCPDTLPMDSESFRISCSFTPKV